MSIRKKIIIGLTLSLFLFAISLPVLAAPKVNEFTGIVAKQGGYETQGVTQLTFSQSIGQIIKVMLSLVGVIFLGLTVYAGILWMTASGSEEKTEKATKILSACVIGLLITVSAYSITVFVLVATSSASGLAAGTGGGSFWGSFWSSFSLNMSGLSF